MRAAGRTPGRRTTFSIQRGPHHASPHVRRTFVSLSVFIGNRSPPRPRLISLLHDFPAMQHAAE